MVPSLVACASSAAAPSCDPLHDHSCVVSPSSTFTVCNSSAVCSIDALEGDASRCPACAAPNLYAAGKQAVRRELRSLSAEQWQRVVDAVWVTRTLSFSEGVAKYGELYKPYDYLVLRHVVLQGLSDHQFGPFHGAQARAAAYD